MKNAYLIVTDLHCDTEKANRLNYFGECLGAIQSIMTIAARYREQGCSVRLIFLGDVFDAGLSNPSDAMQLMEVFYYFCSAFDGVWSVVGNHELSYAKNNPFWFLVSSIQDEELMRLRRLVQPHGLTGRIIVPSTLTDGDTVFYFNHFGVPAKTPTEGQMKIGLFHQNVGSNEICKMWGTFDNVEEASYIQPYNYCYFGHMHLAKGAYWLNDAHTCRGEWLGTLGRTKEDEVQDDSLTVNVPAVIVSDGVFDSVEDNPVTLLPRRETIDMIKLEASQKSRKLLVERKNLVANNYTGETLYQTLEGSFAGTPLAFIFSFLSRPWEDIYRDYKTTLSNPIVSTEETEDKNNGADSSPAELTIE